MKNNVLNWSKVKFKDILTYTCDLVAFDDTEEYTTITVKRRHGGLELREKLFGSQIQTKKQYKLVPGAFIISRVQCWHEAYAIVPDKFESKMIASINYDQFTISPDIDKQFFWWLSFSPTFTQTVRDCAFGVVIEKMVFNRDAWLNKSILLPPIEEQRRIVARIEELAAKIEEARGLRREAVEEVSNVLAAFITHVFSEEKASFWQEGQLGDYILDDCYGTSEKTLDDPTGIPILRMGNIQNGRILTTELKYLYLDDRDRDKQILKKGDILVNRTNSAELVGKCAVFDLEGDYGFASYIIRLRIDQTKANPWLIAAYINSPLGRKYIFQERTQMTGQANINAKKLKALPIKLPSPVEQQQIVEAIDHLQRKIDGLRKQQSQTSAELNALLPSILDKAFKGEL